MPKISEVNIDSKFQDDSLNLTATFSSEVNFAIILQLYGGRIGRRETEIKNEFQPDVLCDV
jgi:hypothetical protein